MHGRHSGCQELPSVDTNIGSGALWSCGVFGELLAGLVLLLDSWSVLKCVTAGGRDVGRRLAAWLRCADHSMNVFLMRKGALSSSWSHSRSSTLPPSSNMSLNVMGSGNSAPLTFNLTNCAPVLSSSIQNAHRRRGRSTGPHCTCMATRISFNTCCAGSRSHVQMSCSLTSICVVLGNPTCWRKSIRNRLSNFLMIFLIATRFKSAKSRNREIWSTNLLQWPSAFWLGGGCISSKVSEPLQPKCNTKGSMPSLIARCWPVMNAWTFCSWASKISQNATSASAFSSCFKTFFIFL
mmetsp:Transcript_69600/g.213385  ORF Transcript_69600/g.213385 Transcript_69600/m.213385 type:complete len:294 (+) Transcript_69600:1155-2036(+)